MGSSTLLVTRPLLFPAGLSLAGPPFCTLTPSAPDGFFGTTAYCAVKEILVAVTEFAPNLID